MEGTSRGFGRDATQKRRRSDEAGPSNTKRPTTEEGGRGNNRIQAILHTRPHDRPKTGKLGTKITLTANYFRLIRKNERLLYKYHVTFEPEVLLARVRNALIFQHKPIFGGYLFDGTQLFVTRKLNENQIELVSRNREGVEHRIKLLFTREIPLHDNESNQVNNLIMRRIMQGLQLKLVQRNYYDPRDAENLAEFSMQLWPGYDTSIRQHEYDILANVDVRTKVMRTETAFDVMRRALGNNFQQTFQQNILGKTVLTDYNNATYRIDDVDFNQSPSSTFTRGDREISFIEYYQQKYNLTIRDPNQPLLVSRASDRTIRGGGNELILLVPELCRMTGLSDAQRNNINLRQAMRPYTALNPNARITRLLDFNRRLHQQPACVETLTDWQLDLERDLVRIPGRQLDPQRLIIGNNMEFEVTRANWNRECGRPLYNPVDLTNWCIIYPTKLENDSRHFLSRLLERGNDMLWTVQPPSRRFEYQNTNEMQRLLHDAVQQNPQMILCIIDNNRAEIYNQIKRKLCLENAIPSQVVTQRTVTRRNNFDSIVTKIGIQMCTKLGGAPWLPRIPALAEGIMTIGFDISVDTADRNQSFGALVATMDLKQGANFYSAVSIHANANELSTEFSLNVVKALRAYQEKHNALPNQIIIYRGGVGDGQIGYVRDIEVSQVETKLKAIYKQSDQKLELLFIIVNKRINTRIFLNNNNPPAGTIVDDVITLPERYEFYLVPQNTTQGTASPTLYNVIYDTTDWTPGRVQLWTYIMCHIYYNWSGTVRVPAVMQYATKLSFLVANSIHLLPRDVLSNKLYFL